jgi:hypothetical protein
MNRENLPFVLFIINMVYFTITLIASVYIMENRRCEKMPHLVWVFPVTAAVCWATTEDK